MKSDIKCGDWFVTGVTLLAYNRESGAIRRSDGLMRFALLEGNSTAHDKTSKSTP